MTRFFILFFLCFSTFSHAANEEDEGRHHSVFVKSGASYIKRTRAGGSHQKGLLGGAQVGYNRLKNNGFYWEVNTSFSAGNLRGKNGVGESLYSHFRELNVEGRFGYTWVFPYLNQPTFTPYLCYGYFEQTNRLLPPSPLPIKFRDSFQFTSIGFLSQLISWRKFTLGANFQAKFMLDAKSKVDDPDPEFGKFYLPIGNKTHYMVEVPMSYCLIWRERPWYFTIIPYYEFRQFGAHQSYPFDFLKTCFQVYGARIALEVFF